MAYSRMKKGFLRLLISDNLGIKNGKVVKIEDKGKKNTSNKEKSDRNDTKIKAQKWNILRLFLPAGFYRFISVDEQKIKENNRKEILGEVVESFECFQCTASCRYKEKSTKAANSIKEMHNNVRQLDTEGRKKYHKSGKYWAPCYEACYSCEAKLRIPLSTIIYAHDNEEKKPFSLNDNDYIEVTNRTDEHVRDFLDYCLTNDSGTKNTSTRRSFFYRLQEYFDGVCHDGHNVGERIVIDEEFLDCINKWLFCDSYMFYSTNHRTEPKYYNENLLNEILNNELFFSNPDSCLDDIVDFERLDDEYKEFFRHLWTIRVGVFRDEQNRRRKMTKDDMTYMLGLIAVEVFARKRVSDSIIVNGASVNDNDIYIYENSLGGDMGEGL